MSAMSNNARRRVTSIGAIYFGISGCLMGLAVFSTDPLIRVFGIAGLVGGTIVLIQGWRARRQRSRGL
jgi:uncharacterized membrane protein HdeD (DUF308 family)